MTLLITANKIQFWILSVHLLFYLLSWLSFSSACRCFTEPEIGMKIYRDFDIAKDYPGYIQHLRYEPFTAVCFTEEEIRKEVHAVLRQVSWL